MQNEPYNYSQLRAAIHNILYSYCTRELECAKDNEFDFEMLELKTDDILRLIRRQGGKYNG